MALNGGVFNGIKKSNNEYMTVGVWDWQTRVLHWVNVLLVITLILLALSVEGMEFLGVEKSIRKSVKGLHAYIGYILVFTLFLRILWGFLGNKFARWKDIIPYKEERWYAIGGYLKWYLNGFKGRPPIAIGHNPLSSLFYIALFLVLISQAITGLSLTGLELDFFPASLFFSGFGEEIKHTLEDGLGEVHEFGFWFIAFFIVIHLAGIVIHEVKEKTGLLSSMIHGRKYFPKDRI
ncbi:MAG: cytochrome b/b6 domain-containing protein [Nitrospinae bacterium]|nr:cytochrome b/b6 domain-containing protein [Nitrospinota bacterium]